jgi:proteic killer suppression protein
MEREKGGEKMLDREKICGILTHITYGVTIRNEFSVMIQSFRDRETEKLFSREGSRRIPAAIQRSALRKLVILDAAESVHDLLLPPGNQLEKLTGDREGQFSIRINDRWRICFRWRDGDAQEVEIVDYH